MPRWIVVALLFLTPVLADAGEKKTDEPKFDGAPRLVPFRLSDTHHTIIRVKINGKGPFNFVLDTGCPVFLIAEPVGKQIGLAKGWATLDTLEMEGGLELKKVKARVETPFQIEGMNGMGLAGIELHGLMGYTVLAKYKMDFDYTKRQMTWTPLKSEPLAPQKLGKGGGGGDFGMDMMVGMVKLITWLAGTPPKQEPQPRGFFGFEIESADAGIKVARVLADSPAQKAGLMKGDRIVMAEGKKIAAVDDVLRLASKIAVGKSLTLTIERAKKTQELKITAGEGL